jgi:hypothetical protein
VREAIEAKDELDLSNLCWADDDHGVAHRQQRI